MTDPSGVITANAGDAEDANTKTPFSAQETVLKAHQSDGEGQRGGRIEGEKYRSCKRRVKREEAPAGTGTIADVVVGDVPSSTESVSDPSGPAGFRSGSTGAWGGPTQLRLIAKAAETVGQITRLPK